MLMLMLMLMMMKTCKCFVKSQWKEEEALMKMSVGGQWAFDSFFVSKEVVIVVLRPSYGVKLIV